VADEKEPLQSPGLKSDVWDYVRRRNELDKEIQEKFARPVTIMFTDIKGSTTFFDMRGDLEGVTMLQRHNELVVPPIEAHGGRVLQRLGDGLLATFPSATPGVKAGIEIQKRLHEYNSRAAEREQIHVRVGLNSGMGLVEESNVFGDAVNTAARVQTLAEPDQILVSESTYKESSQDLGTDIFLPVGPAALKGKLEKVVVLEVIWSPEQARLRAAVQPDRARGVLHLDISRTGDRLKVVSHEMVGGEEAALREVEEATYDEAQVGQAVQRVESILGGADRDGRIPKQNLEDLAGLGHQLWDLLLTPNARARLSGSTAPELVLTLDDQLTRIPWELLNDGREFLCLRFAMGRVVSTAKQLAASKPRDVKGALKIALVADPQGTLPEALREGTQLGTHLGDRPEFQPVVNDRVVGKTEFLAQFGASDILHVAGQAEYDASNAAAGGFALSDGRVSATDLARLPSGATVPRLMYFTACEAAAAGQNRHNQAAVFGLASAILTAGVKHFVASLRAVPGSAGFQFAADFYRLLAGGQTIGTAVREARREAARRGGKTELTWAAYVLYGDPTSRYFSGRVEAAPAGRPAVLERKRLMALLGGAAAVVVVAGGLFYTLAGGGGKSKVEAAYRHLEAGRLADAGREFQNAVGARPAEAYEGLALVALRQGDPVAAQKFCGEVQRIGASRPGCVLMQGDVAATQGDLSRAAASYDQVISFAGVPNVSKSIAYTRLGRLSAEQGQNDKAATAYTDAQKADPGNWEALSNMGALLRRQGRYAEAATALDRAAAINPGDPMVQTLLKDVRESEGSAKDAEKQKRVDALVDELAARFKKGDVVRPPAGRDDWTSPPLTISFLGLESRGRMAFREGEYDFMLLRIGQALEGQTRARLVERNVMDKLLAELKLSSSALADQKTALQLGRVLSARLITVGTVAGGANEWTLTLRVIETETSTVVASVAQGFPLSQSTAQVADVVAKDLAAKLRKTFPLRARVTGGGKGEAVLNVGTGEGAAVGQKLLIFREGAGGQRDVVGEAEITEVTDKTSRAKLADETKPITPGLKALERS
jgi:class 3 adenylate cyclase/CHAT domain-containing protein/tetratricopeptide (TPR) repeat protein